MSKDKALGIAVLPQVNLLPPEIRAKRAAGVATRWLIIAVLTTVALVALGTLFTMQLRSVAEDELATARIATEDLLAEQMTYSEVTPMLTALANQRLARSLTYSTEVEWADYLTAFEAVLPPATSISTAAVTRIDPGTTLAALNQPAIAVLTFTGHTATVPDQAAWIDALNSLTGFADARVTVGAVTGDTETTVYEYTTEVRVTLAAASTRFATIMDGE